MTLDEFRSVIARAIGTAYGTHDVRWTSRFHSDERQSPRYRVGRVTGRRRRARAVAGRRAAPDYSLQDAANLGRKLAADVRGSAPPELLDSTWTSGTRSAGWCCG